MGRIEAGSRVSVQYIGTLDNGRTFDSTTDEAPLAFTVGAGEIFPALEEAIVTMKVGEVRNIVIAASDAYGPRVLENLITIDRSQLPAGKSIGVGQKLNVEFGLNSSRVMIVSAVTETSVTLDGNHPLAGQDLTFALRLDRVEP